MLQLLLIALNAFFAASEIALITQNEGKLRMLSKEGDKKADRLLKLVTEPAAFLSTIQIGITLAGFLASAFAARAFSDAIVKWLVESVKLTAISRHTLNTMAVILITLILSFFMLVLGELVPKRIAMKKSEKMAMAIGGIILFFSVVFKPVIWLLSVSTNGVLRLFGINPKEDGEAISEDDIRMMIDIGEEKGTIESTEKEMIENIFEFNNITAGDIMVHRLDVSMVYEDDTPEEIFELIKTSGFSRFPVCGEDADDIIGILRTREYLLNEREISPKPLRSLLIPAHFVPETVKADALFRNMQKNNIHIAVVVDEYGGTSGIVTMEDLLEEIVGNIYDESDSNEQDIIQLDEDTWRVRGSVSAEDFAEVAMVDFDVETEEYETVGGMVISRLNQIPQDSEKPEVVVQGLQIKVEEVADRRIEWTVIKKLPVPVEEKEKDKDKDKTKDKEKLKDKEAEPETQ